MLSRSAQLTGGAVQRLGAVVVALALVGACSSDTDPSAEPSDSPTVDAQVQNEEFDRMRAALAGVDSVRFTLTQDRDDSSQSVEITLGGLSGADEDLVAQMVMRSGETEQESLVTDGRQFLRGDFAEVDLGGRWVETPIDEESLAELRATTPRTFIEELGDAVIAFEPEGDREEIDGEPTQPYAVTLDPDRLSVFLPESSEESGTPTGTFWIGDDGLPRRFIGRDAGGDYVFEFSRWDEPVDIQPPAPEDVLTEDEVRDLLE